MGETERIFQEVLLYSKLTFENVFSLSSQVAVLARAFCGWELQLQAAAALAQVCCSVLQRVAACCSVLQRVAVYCSV